MQKPTADAIDSNVKANMGFCRCFALKTRQAIEAVLDYTDDLPSTRAECGRAVSSSMTAGMTSSMFKRTYRLIWTCRVAGNQKRSLQLLF